MTYRSLVLLLAATSLASTTFVAACSSEGANGIDSTEPDAATDATAPVIDSAPTARDGGASPREPARDAGAGTGHCSPVLGACDLVAQDCPGGQQCVATRAPGGIVATACIAVAATQSIQKGYPCCRDAFGSDPCLPGLACVGGESCPDGGAPTGKCTPYCCEGDDSVCGNDNNASPGRCSLTIVGEKSEPLYRVCTYANICRPLGVTPCPQGYVCNVTDPSGTAKCNQIFAPDGGIGLPFRARCAAGNACKSGLECLGTGDGGSLCEYLCHVASVATPFDAGALSNAPGKGGCPSAAPTCRPVPNLFPAWLGVCQ
jgi:hypothetical protein